MSRSSPGPTILLALLALVALPAAASAQESPPDAEDRSVIRVSGEAIVEGQPDRARIRFAVETEAETAREAGEENARLMDAVMEAVQELDAPGLEISTSGYSLSPRYRSTRTDEPNRIAGYTARNHVLVTLDDVDRAGRVIDVALDAGANRVASLSFEIQDTEPYRREALRRAVEQARTEAEIMAEALGGRLGVALEVQGGAERPQPRASDMQLRGMEMAMDAAPTTPVEAGIQQISARVQIQFRFHPEG